MQSIYDNIALKKFLEEQGEKPFRITQIFQASTKTSWRISLNVPLYQRSSVIYERTILTYSEGEPCHDFCEWSDNKISPDTHDDKHIECVIMHFFLVEIPPVSHVRRAVRWHVHFVATGKLRLLHNLTVGDSWTGDDRDSSSKKNDFSSEISSLWAWGKPFLNYHK